MVFSAFAVSAGSANAVGESLETVLSVLDGTPGFDATDGPGLDSGQANGIVRTNDNLTYRVEISVNDAPGTNVTFTLPLPQGVELSAVPPYCQTGSSLTPSTLPAPAVPATLASWTTLPIQTLVCNVGDRTAFSTFTYPVVAKVRSEVPNGTNLDPASASSISDDVPTPAVSSPVNTQVSARAQFDISKNSTSETESAGYYSTQGIRACADGSARQCYGYVIPMVIAAPLGGKGTTPLQMPVTFTDDLTPLSLYGAAAVADPDYVAAGAGAEAKYGAILVQCRALTWSQPYPFLGGAGNQTTSVRQSGTTTCTQPGGPGTEVDVSITGMDSSAYTVPSQAHRPTGRTLPANRGYVYSWSVYVQIPVETVIDLGIADSLGTTWTLNWDNRYTNFNPVGIDGVSNDPAAQDAFNDHRASRTVASTRGSFNKWYVGIGNAPGNVPPAEFSPGWAISEGPPGGTSPHSGEAQIYPGQRILSFLHLDARSAATQQDVSFLVCDGWDPALLHLAAGDYPASLVAPGQRVPSNGEAVWMHGRHTDSGYATAANPQPLPMTIEYGNGATGAGTTCTDADSPSGWHSDPASVPGNDAVLAATGVYTAVSQVRVHVVVPPHQNGVGTWTWIAIGLQAADGLAVDTILPNYATGKVEFGNNTQLEMLTSSKPWSMSTYVPATNVGRLGDRVRVGTAVARLVKEVRDPGTGNWVLTTPAVTGGDLVDFQLRPSITAATGASVSVPLRVEDCLPAGQVFVSSTTSPTSIEPVSPPGSGITCGAGETYVLWDLGPMPLNEVVAPIEYTVRISPLVNSGTLINRALVTAEGDPSAINKRDASASVQVTQPAGISLGKRATTPQVEINRPGETNPDVLRWRTEFANFDTTPGPTSPDVIDVLPVNGQGGTSYNGTLGFVSATVVAGGSNVELLYTSEPSVHPDPNDATNQAAGSTMWCDQPAGGAVILGTGLATECPQSPADVTGIRIRRPGPFGAGSQVTVDITMLPESNAADDVYVNSISARAGGLVEIVGPVTAPERVVDSSIGNLVWHDVDGDGIREAADNPIAGVTVTLTGIDSDGNAVTLSTVSDAFGLYLFRELPSGDYDITFGLPPVSALGEPHFTLQSVGLDPTVDSDGDPTTGTASVTLPSNFNMVDVDQGVFFADPAVAVVKRINGDEASTSPGVVVNLGSSMNVTFDVTNTGNVPLSTVAVVDDQITAVVCPVGVVQPGETIQCTASHPAPAAGVVHHNTATATARPSLLSDGAQLVDVSDSDDAYANSSGSSIAGQVFHDVNDDGSRQVAEIGIAGVEITLTGTDDYGNTVIRTTTTNVTGQWSFTALAAGTYQISETQPVNYNDGQDTVGTAGGTLDSAGDTFDAVILAAGEDATAYDFGELGTGLSGIVWLDRDASGVHETAETVRLEGVEMTLLDAAGNSIATTSTNAVGFYSFTGLPAGNYQVVQTQPGGYGSTTRNTQLVSVPLTGLPDVDFGEQLASIDGTIWNDVAPDGLAQTGDTNGETFRSGVVVVLLDTAGNAIDSVISNPDGSYRFDDVPLGSYSIRVTPPAGLALTLQDQGVDNTKDSDVDWVTGVTDSIVVGTASCVNAAGDSLPDCPQPVSNIDAGLITNKINLIANKTLATTSTSIARGDSVAWTLTATNSSTTPLPGVTITDPLPADLDYVSASGQGWACGFDATIRTVQCDYVATLSPGQTAPAITVVTKVTRAGVTISNATHVRSLTLGRSETATADNVSSSTVTVRPGPQLALTGSSPRVPLIGLAMLLGGALVLALSRRQRIGSMARSAQ